MSPVIPVSQLPPVNDTVWFYDSRGETATEIYLHGWHIGWHSGTRWHSYFTPKVAEDDSAITHWREIEFPPMPQSPR
jgi:hypothetical protein